MFSLKDFIKENFDNVIIKNIIKNDIKNVLDVCVIVFEEQMEESELIEYLNSTVNWDISKMAVLNNKVIGCYLLSENSVLNCEEEEIIWKEDISLYEDKNGIEGVALCVLPEYRDLGIGKKLRDVPFTMDYDYIWGMQYKSLNNIDNWTKFGRRIVGENEELYITLIDIK